MQNNDFCNKSRCEFLKFLIQLTFLVSLLEQICRKYFLKGFDNFLNHVLGLMYAITNYFKWNDSQISLRQHIIMHYVN